MNFYSLCKALDDPTQVGCAVLDAVFTSRALHREVYHDARRCQDYRNRECNAILVRLEKIVGGERILPKDLLEKHHDRLDKWSNIYDLFFLYHAFKFICQAEPRTEESITIIAQEVGGLVLQCARKKPAEIEEYQKEAEKPRVEYLRMLEESANMVRRRTKVVLEVK